MEFISRAIAVLLLCLPCSFAATDTANTTTQCNQTYSCLDCTTSRVCRPTTSGELTLYKVINCPSDTPYCQFESGTCGEVPDKSCGEEDDFICLSDGYFPDGNNSTVYHQCEDLSPMKFYCLTPGEIYNPATKLCETHDSIVNFECPGRGVKTPHPLDPSYFGYCQANNVTLVVDRCPPYYALNVTSQLCEPHCTEDGVIPSADSCLDYFVCQSVYVGSTLAGIVSTLQSCPDGTGFDSSLMNCASLDSLICVNVESTDAATTATASETQTTLAASTTFTIPSN